MKRIRSIIFNAMTVLSLFLCVATAGLWVRNYAFDDIVFFTVPGRRWYQLVSIRGGIEVSVNDPTPENTFDRLHTRYEFSHGSHDLRRRNKSVPIETNILGFKADRFIYYGGGMGSERMLDIRSVRVPNWSIIGFFILLPTAKVYVLWAEARKNHQGRCVRCSYDLRASPDRCPECGTVPNEAKA